MNKYIGFYTLFLFIFISVFFSGCSLTSFWTGGGFEVNTNNNGITSGIIANNPPKSGEENYEDIDTGEGIDEQKLYNFLNGIKVAYDSSEYYSDLSKESLTQTLLMQLKTELVGGYENFAIESFITKYALYNYEKTTVTRALWLYNIIEQYQILSKLILTDLVGDYGLGYEANTIIESIFYDKFNFGNEKEPTDANKNTMHFLNPTTITSLSFSNPNYGTSYEYADIEKIEIKLSNSKMILGENSYNIYCPNSVISSFDSWKLNLLDTEISQSFAQSFVFSNPLYNASASSGDICSYKNLALIGNIDYNLGQITYSIGTSVSMPEDISSNVFLGAYLQNYSQYFAYKILEIASNVDDADKFNGTPAEIELSNFLDIIPHYLKNGGMLGFVEKDFELEIGELSFQEKLCKFILDEIIGDDNANLSQNVQNIVSHRLNQYVVQSADGSIDAQSADENAVLYFTVSPNIEWIDIPLEQLFPSKSGTDTVNADDEEDFLSSNNKFVSIVFMVNENLEVEMFYEALALCFVSEENEIDITSYFRFVKDGKEEIFAQIDYEKCREVETTDNGDEMSSTFDGVITKLETEEINSDYIDQNTLYVAKNAVPQANLFLNYELLVNNFNNNLPSNYNQSANLKNNRNYYVFNKEKKTVNYYDLSENSDYFELSFNTSNEQGLLKKFKFSLATFALTEKE